MSKNGSVGNQAVGTWAPLSNITLAAGVLERAMNRSPNLPGIVVFNGPPGYGKTEAALYCANKFNGIAVECRSFFTAKSLMTAILKEAGLVPGRTLSDMMDQLVEELRLSRRALIVDEVDHIAEAKSLQILRDIHDAAQCAIMLIGEERLPQKLQRTERFHSRVLVWQQARPATERDAQQLARFYSPGVEIAEDLLKALYKASRSVVRRICVNVDEVREFGQTRGIKRVSLADWGDKPFYTGEAPARRAA
jgi:DNA transposition AAA+ family ATPase